MNLIMLRLILQENFDILTMMQGVVLLIRGRDVRIGAGQ